MDLARLLQHPAPSEWQEIADKLKIPYDPGLMYHPEFDGYKKGESFFSRSGIATHAFEFSV